MTIGVASPVSLDLLNIDYKGKMIPEGYPFPLVSSYVNGILKKGCKVIVYTTSEKISKPLIYEDKNITVCIARRNAHAGRDFFKSEREDLLYLMKKYPADVISAQWSYEFAWAALDSGIPTLVTVRDHATTILRYQTDPYRCIRWIMNRIVLNKAKYITTNSDYLLRLLDKKHQRKGVVINNFFKQGLEELYNTGIRQNFIVSVANGFGKRKNVLNSLKAFAIIRKNFPQIELYLIGFEMEENGKAHNYARNNNLWEGVKFLGNLPFSEVIEKIKNAQLLLHSSREESFGNVLLEAMVVGTPVIGGKNSGNVPYLLGKGRYGLTCDVNKPKNIADSVINLLNDKNEMERLKWEAHNYAVSNFSEEAIVDKYILQLQKLYNVTYPKIKDENLIIK